eukprot:gene17673-19435_t
MIAGGEVIQINNDIQFKDAIKNAGDRIVVVDFFAKWCGPCQFIAPHFETFSRVYNSATFLKVDVDQCQETAIRYGISAMPTFCIIQNKVKLDEVRGANPDALESIIKKYIHEFAPKKDQGLVNIGRGFESFLEVSKNPAEIFMKTSELLIKFADNVLKDPENKKYRSVRLDNKIFQSRLLPVPGAVECLFQMGFQEEDDKLVLAFNCPLDNLRAMREALLDECEVIKMGNVPVDSHPPVIASRPTRNWMPFIRNANEKAFHDKLISSSNHVFIYEDPKILAYAASKIPLDDMRNEAKSKSHSVRSEDGKNEVDERDCLLLLLLDWFKSKFFSWMNQPRCDICDKDTQAVGHANPTEDDRRWGAGVVENYKCQNCNRAYVFPRYNHPQKLLETRKGRCGEWANCFTLCCRAAGFEARYVLDWTDHVWTEVYSEHQKRWLHCDPCENVCDKPLLYESGWGKKLSYVVAFSKDEVIDVTWRYSQEQKDTLSRRRDVSESWLVDLWMNMTKDLQASSTDTRRKILEERRIKELVEFLSSKNVSAGEQVGRQSGSLAWRTIRGETGPVAAQTTKNEPKSYIFVLTDEELKSGQLCIRYCPAVDKYYRSSSKDQLDKPSSYVNGWQNGVENSENIFRKVEQDWKMVYLARNEGKQTGSIGWRIKIENPSYAIDTVEVKALSTTFENGTIDWKVSADTGQAVQGLPSGDISILRQFHGSSDLSIKATLSGGMGDVAWQHAQLFRQSTDDFNKFPLDITLTFTRK